MISRHHGFVTRYVWGFFLRPEKKESVFPGFDVILNSFYSQTSVLDTFKLIFRTNDKIYIKITNNSHSAFLYVLYSGFSWRNILQFISVRSVAALLTPAGWR